MDNEEKDLSEQEYDFFETSVEGYFDSQENQCPCRCLHKEDQE